MEDPIKNMNNEYHSFEDDVIAKQSLELNEDEKDSPYLCLKAY